MRKKNYWMFSIWNIYGPSHGGRKIWFDGIFRLSALNSILFTLPSRHISLGKVDNGFLWTARQEGIDERRRILYKILFDPLSSHTLYWIHALWIENITDWVENVPNWIGSIYIWLEVENVECLNNLNYQKFHLSHETTVLGSFLESRRRWWHTSNCYFHRR